MVIFQEKAEKRRVISENYTKLITENCSQIVPPYIEDGNTSVYAPYTIALKNRESMIQNPKNTGILSAVYNPVPLNQQPVLETQEFDLSVAESLSRQVMSLPMHPYLTEKQKNQIIKALQI